MQKKVKNNKKLNNVQQDKGVICFSLVEVLIIIVVAIVFGGVIGACVTVSRLRPNNKVNSSNLSNFIVAYNSIVSEYYDKVDKSKLINAAIEGMLNSLDDPHSVFMDSSDTEDFNTTVSGEYKGIGATISIVDEKVMIVDIFKDSPAFKAGLKAGDEILFVNDKDVHGMDLDKVVKLIKKKSVAKMKIIRGEEEKEIRVNVGDVSIPSVSSEIFKRNDKKVGYLGVSVFAANTYGQFKGELLKLENKKIDSLIIDVRGNPGGHLDQVGKIISLFMNKKKVIYQVKQSKRVTKIYSSTDEMRKYEIVVLIDSSSASASEILAAAMKESYGATLVGKKSYGKGTVQKEFGFGDGTSMKYTTEQWLTPKGNSINKKGVKPDEVVDLEEKYFETFSKDDDTQLQKAIDILSGSRKDMEKKKDDDEEK